MSHLIQHIACSEELWKSTWLGSVALGVVLGNISSQSNSTIFAVAMIHAAIEVLVAFVCWMMMVNVIFRDVCSLHGQVVRGIVRDKYSLHGQIVRRICLKGYLTRLVDGEWTIVLMSIIFGKSK